MSHLKKVLFEAFDGFADKRIKNLEKSSRFIADDRTTTDRGADGVLFLWFCAIFVDVVSEAEVSVRLMGGVPMAPTVTAWIDVNGGSLTKSPTAALTVSVTRGRESTLLSLAAAIEAIVQPGKKYSVSSYRYVCPRTGESLRRLAHALSAAWGA